MTPVKLILPVILLLAPFLVFLRKGRVNGMFFAAWVCFFVGYILSRASYAPYLSAPILTSALIAGVYTAVKFRGVKWFARPVVSQDGKFTAASVSSLFVFCVAGPLGSLGLDLGYRLLHRAVFGLQEADGNRSHVLLDCMLLGETRWTAFGWACFYLWLAAVCTALMEEIFFRGLIQKWAGRRWRPWVAIAVAGCLFGAMHGPHQFIPKSLAGIYYGWLAMRFHSLIPPILAHAVVNFVVMLSLIVAITFGHLNPVWVDLHHQRRADLASDAELARLAVARTPETNQDYETSRRKIYEPSVIRLLQNWGYAGTTITQILDAWEKSQAVWWDSKGKLDLEAPLKVGDRRDAWKVKRWTEHRENVLHGLNSKRDSTMLGLLRDEKQYIELKTTIKQALDSHFEASNASDRKR